MLDNNGAESLIIPGEIIFKWHVSMLKLKSVYMSQQVFEEAIEHALQNVELTLSRIGDMAASIFPVNTANKSIKEPAQAEEEITEEEYDEYLPQAIDIVLEMGSCSVSMLQRRLKLGYSHAARLVDQMEEIGVVGPYKGAAPRSVLVDYNPFYSDEDDSDEDSDYGNEDDSDEEYEEDFDLDQRRDIPLRDFHFFTTKGGTVSIYGNRVHLSKQVMTKVGQGTAKSEISGKMISGIFYRAPSIFSSGYFQFTYYSDADITNQSPHIIGNLSNRKAAEYSRIEIGKSDVGIVKMFLQQLSEDTNIPITRA